MSRYTDPPIGEAQNRPHARRLLAAQARLYSDVKRVHNLRLALVVLVALATAIVALSVPTARTAVGSIGGILLFAYSLLASRHEKRRAREAASVQEEFDTYVFQLPWNDFAAERPSPTLIAEAASRYRGRRTRDWYPSEASAVVRPLDVLICQRSNLGWGASVHRLWAALLTGAFLALAAAAVLCAWLLSLTLGDLVSALVMPLLGPARELVDMIRANRDSAETKQETEKKVLGLWEVGIAGGAVTEAECRAVQDKILSIRQANAHIPDLLDNMRRARSESAMLLSTQHLIEQAREHGNAGH